MDTTPVPFYTTTFVRHRLRRAALLLSISINVLMLVCGGHAWAATAPAGTSPGTAAAPATPTTPAATGSPATAATPTAPVAPALPDEAIAARVMLPTSAQWLGSGAQRFVALFIAAAAEKPAGTVILLADTGRQADDPGLIYELRRCLPQHQWNTLAIGLPENTQSSASNPNSSSPNSSNPNSWDEILSQEVQRRLQLAHDALTSQQQQNLALFAHGNSARLALQILQKTLPANIHYLILAAPEDNILPGSHQALAALSLPILELFDGSPQAQTIQQRHQATAKQAGRKNLRSIRLLAANRDFALQADTVCQRLTGFLKQKSQ